MAIPVYTDRSGVSFSQFVDTYNIDDTDSRRYCLVLSWGHDYLVARGSYAWQCLNDISDGFAEGNSWYDQLLPLHLIDMTNRREALLNHCGSKASIQAWIPCDQ